MTNGLQQKIDLEKKFARVYKEINVISSKIGQKQGFWIFETHVHSQESLLNSEHHYKIDSITEKIGDDVVNWNNNNQLSKEGRKCYEKEKNLVIEKLENVNEIIANREPTWWEQVMHIFTDFIVLIEQNMPDVALRLFGGLLPQLPGIAKRVLALLPGSTKN